MSQGARGWGKLPCVYQNEGSQIFLLAEYDKLIAKNEEYAAAKVAFRYFLKVDGYLTEVYIFLKNFQSRNYLYNKFFLKTLYDSGEKEKTIEQYQRLVKLTVKNFENNDKKEVFPSLELSQLNLELDLLFDEGTSNAFIESAIEIIESNAFNIFNTMKIVVLLWNSEKANNNQKKRIVAHVQYGIRSHSGYIEKNFSQIHPICNAVLARYYGLDYLDNFLKIGHYKDESESPFKGFSRSHHIEDYDIDEMQRTLSALGILDKTGYEGLEKRMIKNLKHTIIQRPFPKREVLWAMLGDKAPIINFMTPRAKYTLDYVRELTPFSKVMKEKFAVEIAIRQQNLNTSGHPHDTIYKVYFCVKDWEEMYEYTSQHWHDSEVIIKLFNEILSKNGFSERWISLGSIDDNNLFILIKPENYTLINEKYGVRYDD